MDNLQHDLQSANRNNPLVDLQLDEGELLNARRLTIDQAKRLLALASIRPSKTFHKIDDGRRDRNTEEILRTNKAESFHVESERRRAE